MKNVDCQRGIENCRKEADKMCEKVFQYFVGNTAVDSLTSFTSDFSSFEVTGGSEELESPIRFIFVFKYNHCGPY